ncbi:hypothetical protein ACFLU6_10705 [Acidobacteriota bacterium]
MSRRRVLTEEPPRAPAQAKTYNQLGIALRGSDPEDPEKNKEAVAAYRKVLELTEGKVDIVKYNLAQALTAQADTEKKLDRKEESSLYIEAYTLLLDFLKGVPEGPTAERARMRVCGSKDCVPFEFENSLHDPAV